MSLEDQAQKALSVMLANYRVYVQDLNQISDFVSIMQEYRDALAYKLRISTYLLMHGWPEYRHAFYLLGMTPGPNYY